MARTLVWTGANGTSYSDPGNWNDLTDALNPATSPPGTTDIAVITGDYSTITGSGAALDVTLELNPDLRGTLYAQNSVLVLGQPTLDDNATLTAVGAVSIAAGGLLYTQGGSTLYAGGSITIAAGGVLYGDGIIDSPVLNAGAIEANTGSDATGTLEFAGPITGPGTIIESSYAALKLDSTEGGEPILFTSFDNGQLTVTTSALPTGTISGFGRGDTVVVLGAINDTASSLFANGVTTLQLKQGSNVAGDLYFQGSPSLGFDASTGVITASGRYYRWNAPAGTQAQLGAAASWLDTTNGSSAAARPPGTYDHASFTNGAVLGGSATVEEADMAGAITLDGTLRVLSPYGNYTAQPTTLTIAAGAALQAPVLADEGFGTTALTINVQDGGTLQSLGLTEAENAYAVAAGLVQGATAVINVGGAHAVLDPGGGGVQLGGNASGVLNITGGATVTDGMLNAPLGFYWTTDIANKPGSKGTLSVSGAGSRYNVAQRVVAGDSGDGAIIVSAGASVNVESTSIDLTDPNAAVGLQVGSHVGASGTVIITDSGSQITTLGNIGIGQSGLGQATIENGATLLDNYPGATGESAMLVGVEQSASGSSLLVTGAGSLVKSAHGSVIGVYGSGTLNIANGAHYDEGDYFIAGFVKNTTGVVTVDGAGSELTVRALVPGGGVSAGGTGVITVSHGGAIFASSQIHMFAGGTLSLDSTGMVEVGSTTAAQSGRVVVDAAGTVYGAGTLAATIVNNGTVTATTGVLELARSVSGPGTLHIAGDGTLKLDALDSGAPITFDAPGGTLDLAAATALRNTGLAGFTPGDAVIVEDAVGATASSASAGGTTTLTFFAGSAPVDSIAFTGTPTLAFDSATGVVTACFAAGTRIATARGEVTVEALAVGDLVRLAHGGMRPVRWIGWRAIDLSRHPRPWDVMPVRVAAHAFAPGQPARDLRLSPDHAVAVEGVLIPVRHLLNGATVVQEHADRIAYFHVELDAHDILLAEGLPCESYLDTGNRCAFANGGAVVQAHADFARAAWAARACAPLREDGAQVVLARAMLLQRAQALGHRLTRDPGLRLEVDGRALHAERHHRRWSVELPSGARTLRLRSRVWIPAHTRPDENDTRRLGVAITGLQRDGLAVALESAALGAGWYASEGSWRWTDGDAHIAPDGARHLSFAVAMTGTYWWQRREAAARAA